MIVDLLSSCVRRKVEYGVAVPMSPNRNAIIFSESPSRDMKLWIELHPPESLPTCQATDQYFYTKVDKKANRIYPTFNSKLTISNNDAHKYIKYVLVEVNQRELAFAFVIKQCS